MVKITKLEFAAVLLCTVCVSFSLGWFLRGGSAQPVRVQVQRQAQETVQVSVPSQAPTHTPAPEGGGPGGGGEKPRPAGRVDINTAGVEELQTLPGIGEKRAADIIAWREENGPFRIPEDLTAVKGIGDGILEGLIDYITVGEAAQ